MNVTRAPLAIATPVITMNNFGVVCKVGVAIVTLLVVVKPVTLAAAVVVRE